jgi:hypothetical protein
MLARSALIVAVVVTLLQSEAASAQGPPAFPQGVSAVRSVGKPIVVRVQSSRKLRVTVRGVVTITAKPGTFRRRGRIVIRRVRGDFTVKRALRGAGLGVNVRFVNTAPTRALTLTYRTGLLPRGFRPRVAHVTSDGTWSLQTARVTRAGRLQVRTRSFSSVLPAWLNPKQWLSNLKQWGRNAANWVASGVGGRTQPPGGCGANGPAWFRFDQRSDLLHVCSIDNKGRGEIQIKSNRGLSQVVHVPGSPAYIWVENLPDSMRRRLPWTKANDVVLGPGQLMTVGYNRPQVDTNLTFTSSIHAGWANLDNVVRASMDVLDVPRGAWYLVVAFAYTKCVTDLEPSIGERPFDTEQTVRKAFCVLDVVEELAQDPEQALKFAVELGLDDEGRDKLLASARGLKVIAKRTAEFGLVKDYAVRSIDDALRDLLEDGNDEIDLTMTGNPTTVPAGGTGGTEGTGGGTPQPATRTIVVDNRVTNGPTQMREDTPAYLSTVTRNFCKRDGCALPGTDMGSGAAITAECTTFGSRTTNGQDNSSIDDGNPGLYSSTRWYGVRWGDGRFGYISEVWIRSDFRGGLGLRGC